MKGYASTELIFHFSECLLKGLAMHFISEV